MVSYRRDVVIFGNCHAPWWLRALAWNARCTPCRLDFGFGPGEEPRCVRHFSGGSQDGWWNTEDEHQGDSRGFKYHTCEHDRTCKWVSSLQKLSLIVWWLLYHYGWTWCRDVRGMMVRGAYIMPHLAVFASFQVWELVQHMIYMIIRVFFMENDLYCG